MNKVAIVYWSGTGNTEQMAQAVADGVKNAGGEADVLTCAEFDSAKLADYGAVALITVTAALGASGALNARQNGTQPVQTEAPVQTVEPAQNTPEAVQSEPARPGKKVNMDDTKWADAIEELNDYIDQQIGGDKK